jgi:hypothetical protein
VIPIVAAALIASSQAPDPKTLKTWGSETLGMIRQEYALPNSKLFGERLEDNGKLKDPAFNWGVGVMLSALAAGARVDPQVRPWLREYADATRVYWNTTGPVPGYDVLPAPKPVDRYYDDNAWMVMALVETYEVLGDRKYLGWAEDTLKYVLSGEDEQLGGGIFWKEAEKSSKNTCSNGPSAAAALAVYAHVPNNEYLQAARRIYGWTKKNLQDPEDGLYWDNVNLSGKIEKTKWSYNTALMLRSAIELFRATKEDEFRQDAARLNTASRSRWLRTEGGMADDGKFAHLLFENWIRYAAVATEVRINPAEVVVALPYVREKVRDAQGHYGNRWDRPAEGAHEHPMLIDQASAARAYFVAADGLTRRR